MEAALEEAGVSPPARQKMVRRFVFGLLVLLSALVGALIGLLLVYSTDLPQVEELENYRPISTTELYDIHGQTIGSFALQRRAVGSYQGFPQLLPASPFFPQPKDLSRHPRSQLWRLRRAVH